MDAWSLMRGDAFIIFVSGSHMHINICRYIVIGIYTYIYAFSIYTYVCIYVPKIYYHKYIDIYIYGLMSGVFANGPEDQG